MGWKDLRSTLDSARDAEPESRLCLMVLREDTVRALPVPTSGMLRVGRAPENDLCIDDLQISREHAIIHFGERVLIEDLGSVNGTFVSQSRLEPRKPTEVLPGRVIEVGSTTLVLQHRKQREKPRRVWTHGYFEARLEEECLRDRDRDRESSTTIGILRIRVSGGTSGEPAWLQEYLAGLLQPNDLIAIYAPSEYELLLLGTTRAHAQKLAQRIVRDVASRGASSLVGIACHPEDGRNADALIAHAANALRPEDTEEPEPLTADAIILVDPVMRDLRLLVERVARGAISVLLLGETGVGKEVFAETIHRRSPRSEKPYVRLNCAALSESLMESELFGHERGAFTGASHAKPGLLETAEGGTVFLDEVGEMSPSLQAKLLRVLEQRQVMRVGGLEPRSIDVRFVSATNRDLEAEVGRGTFREDLYYRLNGVTIEIPPLRSRSSEIDALAKLFAMRASRELGRPVPPTFSAAARALLLRYHWPGNIRELKNVIERAILLCTGDSVEPEHLPVEKMTAPWVGAVVHAATVPAASPAASAPASAPEAAADDDDDEGIEETLPDVSDEIFNLERSQIIMALEKCGGNQTRAARMLGIARRTMTNRMNAYQIPRPRKG